MLMTALMMTVATAQTLAQKRPQRSARATASLTFTAGIYYNFGGYQAVAPTEFLLLDTDPQYLISPTPLSAYAVAALLNEPLSNAKLIVSIAALRSDGSPTAAYKADQLESLLEIQRNNQQTEAMLAVGSGKQDTDDAESIQLS
jgi:hypothetical protein